VGISALSVLVECQDEHPVVKNIAVEILRDLSKETSGAPGLACNDNQKLTI